MFHCSNEVKFGLVHLLFFFSAWFKDKFLVKDFGRIIFASFSLFFLGYPKLGAQFPFGT